MTVSDSASSHLRRQRGFTLLELLISIALLGLILVLLFGGLRLGVRSWDAVQRQVDNLNSVRAAEGFLRREIEQAYPYRWKPPPAQRLAFLGQRNKLQFVAPLPSRIGSGGLFLVSLELEQAGSDRRLIWKYLPVHSQMQDFSELENAQGMVLARHELSAIDDIWLSYFGRESDGAAPRWLDRWDSKASIPALVRIQVRFADGSEWPEFIVAPALAMELVR
jgi:general secretion pathway protein J